MTSSGRILRFFIKLWLTLVGGACVLAAIWFQEYWVVLAISAIAYFTMATIGSWCRPLSTLQAIGVLSLALLPHVWISMQNQGSLTFLDHFVKYILLGIPAVVWIYFREKRVDNK
jgi:hypothetical protein